MLILGNTQTQANEEFKYYFKVKEVVYQLSISCWVLGIKTSKKSKY